MIMRDLKNDPVLQILIMALASIAAAAFYKVTTMVIEQIKRRFIVSITLDSNDPNYEWMLKYLRDRGCLANRMNDCEVRQARETRPWWQQMNKDSEKMEVEYLPAPGQHFFRYKGKKVWASQWEDKPQLIGWEQIPEKQRKLVLMCYGQDKELVKELIEDGINHSVEEDKGRLCIYEAMWGYWQKMQTKKARNMDSVVLDEDIAETLKEDIRKFQDSAQWYVDKGVPYRRGYLLYGPPGTGKTSFTQAIAGSLGLNLCYINLGNEMDDDYFNRLLSEAPPRSILLLEDVDSMFLDRQLDSGKSK